MRLPASRIPRAVAAAVALLLLAGPASAQTQPLPQRQRRVVSLKEALQLAAQKGPEVAAARAQADVVRSEEHTSELQSPCNLVCRLLLEKKNNLISRRG